MINVVSRSLMSSQVTGPNKVAVNLVKGLERIGYPYVVNRDVSATKRLWIHDDVNALEYARWSTARTVVGPNLYVMPENIPPSVRLDDMLYVLPGPTSYGYWRDLGFDRCDLTWWPVGIDTEECSPREPQTRRQPVLLYHKHRDRIELAEIESVLREGGIEYRKIVYGSYVQAEYLDALSSASFIVWHGPNESQGIALQEALACGVPVLVCDVRTLGDECSGWEYGSVVGRFPGTAVPYFDERCGLRITNLADLPGALVRMREHFGEFRPRDFVLENLSLEKQAHEFVGLWERWGHDEEAGRAETLLNDRPLSEPWQHRVLSTTQRLRRIGRSVGRRSLHTR